MSEKQIDEQILDNEVSIDKTKINSTENEVADANENEEITEEKDFFLDRIKKLDNNERIFEKDEYVKVSGNESKDEIKKEDYKEEDVFDEFEENKIEEPFTRTKKKKGKAIKIIVPVIILGVILCGLLLPGVKNLVLGNKYNPMGYPVIEGKTFGDAAKVYDCSYKEFLDNNNFPSDIPKNTPIFVAEYYMRVKDIAEKNYSTDYETFKNELGIPETATLENGKTVKINENTMWYIVKDELPLSSIVKEKDFLEYKAYYGLGDDVTTDTLYKTVRPQIEKVLVEEVKVKYGLIEESEKENPEDTDNQTEEIQPEVTEEPQSEATEQSQTENQTEQAAPAEEQPVQVQVAE